MYGVKAHSERILPMNQKLSKFIPYISLTVLFLSLIPLIWLGRYSYPTGDDFYYGAETHLVWESTHSLIQTLKAAIAGTKETYFTWQGSYSGLLLMHLAPNVFSITAYHFVPLVIIGLLCGGIFFLLKPLLCKLLSASASEWITISSLMSFMCVQTVAYRSDSFYWYNGSMYYTGFFAVTLFFFGFILRYIQGAKKLVLLPLFLLAIFLGGGNYVSLLPCMILLLAITGFQIARKKKKAIGLSFISLTLLISFAFSALAPGNSVRQDGMWKIPAWKAVAKSLIQGFKYTFIWARLWWLLAFILLVPVVYQIIKRCKDSGKLPDSFFTHPILFTGFFYGLFASMSCPLFYTMNSIGPVRAIAIIYYAFILTSFLVASYLVGFYVQKGSNKLKFKAPIRYGIVAIVSLAIILTGGLKDLTFVEASENIISGEASGYAAEYEERLNLFYNSQGEDVALTPFTHKPSVSYTGDLPGDTTDPTCEKAAVYFGVRSLYVGYE